MNVMGNKVLYFAYGANRDAKMISAITGKPEVELVGVPAVLPGYALGVQRLQQIPDVVQPGAPAPKSPREILQGAWGEDFETYVIIQDSNSEVHGTVWELTADERERIRDWELVDFGLYHDEDAVAKLGNGTEVSIVTEVTDATLGLDRLVDGKNYETWLADPERFSVIATQNRHEYDQRIAEAEELQTPNPEIHLR